MSEAELLRETAALLRLAPDASRFDVLRAMHARLLTMHMPGPRPLPENLSADDLYRGF